METTRQHPAIREISITGLHGVADVRQCFGPGLNILHAKNGNGKTTVLHVIANILEGDLERFRYLKFAEIVATADDGFALQLKHDGAAITVTVDGTLMETVEKEKFASPTMRKLLQEHFGGRPVYLPAFRTILEALSRSSSRGVPAHSAAVGDRNQDEYVHLFHREMEELRERTRQRMQWGGGEDVHDRATNTAAKTIQCRDWFGRFTPVVRFPSLQEVERQLVDELTTGQLSLGDFDRKSFSNVFSNIVDVVMGRTTEIPTPTFSEVLSSLRDRLEKLESSRAALPDAYAKIASAIQETKSVAVPDEQFATRVLGLYEAALAARIAAQEEAFRVVRAFEESVNEFLQDSGKRL